MNGIALQFPPSSINNSFNSLHMKSLALVMKVIQSFLVFFTILHGSMQFDRSIDTWAEGISEFAKNYKFMSIAELFLCHTMTSSGIHRLVRRLNAKGIYCNVNLIDVTPFGHNSKNTKLPEILSSINFERHPIMLVDTECAFTPALLKLVNFLE